MFTIKKEDFYARDHIFLCIFWFLVQITYCTNVKFRDENTLENLIKQPQWLTIKKL